MTKNAFSGTHAGVLVGGPAQRKLPTLPARFAKYALTLGLSAGCALGSWAAELQLPATVTAGAGLSIPSSGSGEGTLYLVGPGVAIKRKVELGQAIQLSADEVKNAGRYVISIDGQD